MLGFVRFLLLHFGRSKLHSMFGDESVVYFSNQWFFHATHIVIPFQEGFPRIVKQENHQSPIICRLKKGGAKFKPSEGTTSKPKPCSRILRQQFLLFCWGAGNRWSWNPRFVNVKIGRCERVRWSCWILTIGSIVVSDILFVLFPSNSSSFRAHG